jgi:predicted metalloprotease with PDZ domain
LVPADLVVPDYERPTHSESLWVAEGWTAYYDELLPLRAGVWTLERHLDVLRDTWQRVLDTPGALIQSLRQASYEAWVKHYVRDENTPNSSTDYYGHGRWWRGSSTSSCDDAHPTATGSTRCSGCCGNDTPAAPPATPRTTSSTAIADVGDDDLASLVETRVGGRVLPDIEAAVDAVGLRVATSEDGAPAELGVTTSEDDQGVLLTSVLRDRPAWRGGLTGGDRLVAIDGTRVGRGQLRHALLGREPGTEVEVAVLRGPRLLTRSVVLGPPRPTRRLVRVDGPTDAQRTAFRRWTGRALEDAPSA